MDFKKLAGKKKQQQTEKRSAGSRIAQLVVDAKTENDGFFFEEGFYDLLCVKEINCFESTKDEHRLAMGTAEVVFAASFEILLASEHPTHKPRQIVKTIYKSDNQMFGKKIKTLLCALLNISDEDLTTEMIDEITGEDNPLKGCLVGAEAYEAAAKGGKVFTNVRWVSIPEELQGQSDELRELVFTKKVDLAEVFAEEE